MNERPIVMLAGIFTPAQTEYITSGSRGVIQNAADAFQKNIIDGIAANGAPIEIVNLPFIGSYPRGFKRPFFRGTKEVLPNGVPVHGYGFISVRFIKWFSRLRAALTGLVRVDRSRSALILIYSAHLPFLLAAILYRLIYRDSRICLILPDFPEFMGEGSILYTAVKWLESRIFYAVAKRVDAFVVLTRYMAERLRLADDRFAVVEGIADAMEGAASGDEPDDARERPIFLYAGTLASRYGIMDLVEAFKEAKSVNAELWICGEGDAREGVVNAGKEDQRIRYLGQVSRVEARRLQMKASVLVNPRRPSGEFTKYSFPSKTMEYLASGRPVLMYRLPGMPDEYLPHFVQPHATDVASLAAAICDIAGWSAARRAEFGASARKFVLTEKNAVAQCRKIVDLISLIR